MTALSFVDGKANAALLGPPGVGKTHIAVARVAACRDGYPVYSTSLDDMAQHQDDHPERSSRHHPDQLLQEGEAPSPVIGKSVIGKSHSAR